MAKKVILFLLLFIYGFSQEVQVVPITNKVIHYKSKIYSYNVRLVQSSEQYKCKEYLDIHSLKQNKYFSKRYLKKNRILCLKDVYIPKAHKVKFRFGNLEIEKEAELIKETKSYIKIKNLDGTIEKIYTNGRSK